jgi:divalent metal cation (Fe/Co/Zn/Cd) transporter
VNPGEPPGAARARNRQAQRLEWVTIGWNTGEFGITLALGLAARSLALVAYGLESCVEIFASLIVVWHLRGTGSERRTRRAMGLVALAFLGLAAVLVAGAVGSLASGTRPADSPFGIAYLALAVVAMLLLGRAKLRLGRTLPNHPLEHEARITFLDAALAFGILTALVLDATLGWWWADPLAAIAVAASAVPEGLDAWRDHRDGAPAPT